MKIPKHFGLVKEHPASYEIGDKRDGSTFHVAKNALTLDQHANLAGIQKFAEGSVDGPVQDAPDASAQPYGAPEEPFVPPDAAQATDQVDTTQAAPGYTSSGRMPAAAAGSPKGSNLDQTRADIMAGAAAQGKAGTLTAGALEEAQNDLDAKPDPEEIRQKYMAKQTELEEAIKNGMVDPKHWYNSLDTHQRVTNTLGMLLSGAGSAIAHQENFAMKNINNAIDRDITAQQNNQSTRMNLWKMNRQNMDSDMEATAASRNQILTGLKLKSEQYLQNAAGPVAKAKAAEGLMAINQQIDIGNHFLASTSGQGAGTEGNYTNAMNYMQQMKPEYFKDMQSRYVPGVGIGSKPVPEKEQEALVKLNSFQKDLNDAMSFQRKMGESGAWSFENRAKASSMKDNLTLKMGELADLNRFTGEEKPMYQNIIGNIGGMHFGGQDAKMDFLNHTLQNKKNAIASQYGITPFKQADPNAVALQWAQQNLNNPATSQKAQAVLQKLGKANTALAGSR